MIWVFFFFFFSVNDPAFLEDDDFPLLEQKKGDQLGNHCNKQAGG